MPPRALAVLALCLLVAATLAVPAAPALHEPYPAVQVRLDGPGWVAFRLHPIVGRDAVSVTFMPEVAPGTDYAGGFVVLDQHQRVVTNGVVRVTHGLSADAALGGNHLYDEMRGRTAGLGAGKSCPACAQGEFYVVAFVAGRVGPTYVTVYADGSGHLQHLTGSGAFFLGAEDFDLASARAEVGYATYAASGSRTIPSDGRLFASFGHYGAFTGSMQVSTPSGTRACPCGVGGPQDGPGDYAFALHGAGTFGEAVLIGAHAELPTPGR